MIPSVEADVPDQSGKVAANFGEKRSRLAESFLIRKSGRIRNRAHSSLAHFRGNRAMIRSAG